MAQDTDSISAVKARIDIVDLIRRYVELRPVSGRFMGPCPFHQETKGSFSVNPEGFFYCFGCQAAGDVFDFYSRINGVEFREALEALADEAGVELTAARPDPQADKARQLKKACLDMHTLAQRTYVSNLRGPRGGGARAYLERRGLSGEIIESFGLGYAPDEWQNMGDALKARNYTPEQGVQAGILARNDRGRIYDRFRNRLMFPIQDLAGRTIAFGGRYLGDDDNAPKYLNSADSPIYKKGDHLYGLHQARSHMTKTRRCLLTEGYMDVLALVQFGWPEAVGVLGTALTSAQVKRLGGFCRRIDLVFDGDPPGLKAALKSAEMILAAGLDCSVVILPEGQDVDDVLRAEGREGFEKCLDEAKSGLDFALGYIIRHFPPKEMIAWTKEFLKSIEDPTLAAYYAPRLARGLGIAETELRGTPPPRQAPRNGPAGQPAPVQRREAAGPEAKRDREILEFVVRHPEYGDELDRRGVQDMLRTPWAKTLWTTLRQVEDPLAGLSEEHKRFYAQCRLMEPLPEDRKRELWEEICEYLDEAHRRGESQDIKAAMRRALAAGDLEEVNRLTCVYNELLGRSEEDQ